MEEERKVLHLRKTTVNFRPKAVRRSRLAFSPRRDRATGSSDQNLYRCEVYGDRNELGCYFLPSSRTASGRNGTRTRHARAAPRQTRYWLHEDDVYATKPVHRIQSAPMKLSYLNVGGAKRSRRSLAANNRPQTVAPCVRPLTDTCVTDCTLESEGDCLSAEVSALELISDKHDHIPPDGDKHGSNMSPDWDLVMEPLRCTDCKICSNIGGDMPAGKGCVKAEDCGNTCTCTIKPPVKVTFGSVNWIKNSEESDLSEEEYITNGRSVNAQRDENLNTPEYKDNAVLDGTLLSDNQNIHGSKVHTLENTHETLIERIRESYGIHVEDGTEPEPDTEVKPLIDTSMAATVTTAGRQAAMDKGDNSDFYDKYGRCIRSTIQKAPLRRDGYGQGSLVKHLRQQRKRTPNRRKTSPIVDIPLPYGTVETKKPWRNVAGLFLRTSTFVWYVCRLLGAMIDLSAEMTTRSATEEQWHALNTSREARGMAFNKAAFAKRKDVTTVPLWAKRVMRKEPDDRTEQEVKRVHALLRGMKSFDRFTEKIQLSMCKSFVYYKITSGRVILRQGHVGQNFYFLFTGSVFVNIDDVDGKGNKFSKTEAILARGDSFGELALLRDIKRTATITCREDCEMLVVDKDTFARICPRIFEMELEEKMGFVSKMKLFNLRIWDEDSMRKMCFEAQIQEYKTNKVVVVDSDKDNWIYICMEGKCQVIRRLDLMEEIAWRKLNQQHHSATPRRPSRQDFLTVMTGMSNLTLGSKQNHGRSRSGTPAVKQNLLESMGLEYTQKRRLYCDARLISDGGRSHLLICPTGLDQASGKNHRSSLSIDDWKLLLDSKLQHMRGRRESSKEELSTSLHQRGDFGSLTLTSLLANDERANGNHLYLNIHTMQQYDVFDLPSVLKSQEEMETTTGSHILVSLGSRLLRIKRTSYFKYASPDAIELARGLGLKYMYPSDDVLLQRYRDFLHWEVYKYEVLQIALSQKAKPTNHYTSSQRKSGSPIAKRDTAKELFELNKSTLTELSGVLSNEGEPSKEDHWKRVEELKFSNSKEWQKRQTEHTSKTLRDLNQVQLDKLKSPENFSSVVTNTPKRRVSRLVIASEFKTIVEMDE